MSWFFGLIAKAIFGPIIGMFSSVILEQLGEYHAKQLQQAKDQVASSEAQLSHIQAAIEAKRAVDVDIKSRGVRVPDPDSRT